MDYENYFSDFGLRCFELLKPAKKLIKHKKRDVTARLCVMSAALTIPSEVLAYVDEPDPKTTSHHPSGTTLCYPKAADYYHSVLTKEFTKSLGAGGVWHMDEPQLPWAEDWPKLKNSDPPHSPMKETTKVCKVLAILRNALAHGNIGMYEENKIIKTMVFISVVKLADLPKKGKGHPKGITVKFNCVHTSPESFAKFMVKWKELLVELGKRI